MQNASIPVLLDLNLVGQDIVVSFDSSSWDCYYLDHSTDLMNWTRVAGPEPGNGGILELVHPEGASQSRGYYRVGVDW